MLLRKLALAFTIVFLTEPIPQGHPPRAPRLLGVVAYVLFPPLVVGTAASVGSWVIVLALLVHLWRRPYSSPFLNNLDTVTLLATYVTASQPVLETHLWDLSGDAVDFGVLLPPGFLPRVPPWSGGCGRGGADVAERRGAGVAGVSVGTQLHCQSNS